MAKRQVQVRELSYGIYEPFDGRAVPKIRQFGDRIPAEVGVEFGMVLQVHGTRGDQLAYRIDHPRIRDEKGKDMPAFTGEWTLVGPQQEFFLGDCLWEPIIQMRGYWVLSVAFGRKTLHRRRLLVG